MVPSASKKPINQLDLKVKGIGLIKGILKY
jgi:hypothetical protein